MPTKRNVISFGMAALVMGGLSLAPSPSWAADTPLPVVASFSILGDFVRNVGGDRVAVEVLVGPDGDAHVFSPSPADARKVAAAKLVVVNGLGFEGWMPRLVKSAGSKAPQIVATKGITPLSGEDDDDDGHDHGKGGHKAGAKEAHGHAHKNDHGHDHGPDDPHAWQSVANAAIYIRNIRDGLIAADPAGKAVYEANAAQYLDKLSALDAKVKAAIASIPEDRRRIVTSHDAFAYFANAYGLKVLPPQGVSSETEASAKDVAAIIRQIKAEKIPAVFLENISDPRLMNQIAKETGARIGGTVYSDALSGPSEPAPTYIDMMEHNVKAFTDALKP
ncbi:Zinc/manganese transport system substrate-binding protein [Chelatococcus asaccharovorans]|uniref:Zinc/manganese transport system substrate-binding protein n=2 Tax=Chelatococcus asaccharovorans TaxID=28210 RepID=A0A2V3TXH6_9HYPH|nr:metal ABC transporter substrate-binding protein [Chelatococcus asaccharovorans]MBS7704599.1 metal ABC transporter substrate-binding protein [Chelatococcus asaccharovorans]PXW54500.1 zinc/manganese transport system substrate-binding protein [Chelatococcus asaccharovorans]CAH1648668.1 Zinc/manganese transport system substrate-binding protein [Chelatococcus asaccharovorans]CAH1687490.1 Zinc/manganese transport system substrate-binding protein [Chelatococcus asaccharovorans]